MKKEKKDFYYWQFFVLVGLFGGFYLFWDFLQKKTEIDKSSSDLFKEGFKLYNKRYLR